MKDYSELKEEQDELDKEELYCPRCGGIASWYEVREFGVCGNCVEKDYKKREGKSNENN